MDSTNIDWANKQIKKVKMFTGGDLCVLNPYTILEKAGKKYGKIEFGNIIRHGECYLYTKNFSKRHYDWVEIIKSEYTNDGVYAVGANDTKLDIFDSQFNIVNNAEGMKVTHINPKYVVILNDGLQLKGIDKADDLCYDGIQIYILNRFEYNSNKVVLGVKEYKDRDEVDVLHIVYRDKNVEAKKIHTFVIRKLEIRKSYLFVGDKLCILDTPFDVTGLNYDTGEIIKIRSVKFLASTAWIKTKKLQIGKRINSACTEWALGYPVPVMDEAKSKFSTNIYHKRLAGV